MPQQFTENTFKGVYKDDFLDSAGYHRILFNSGRPLQARELTQLQTILQTQITRFARNIFLDGAAVSPKSSGAGTEIRDYVVVAPSADPSSTVLPNNLKDYLGAVFTGAPKTGTLGLKFVVSHVVPTDAVDGTGAFPVLYGRYIDANQDATNSTDVQTTPLTYGLAETLTSPGLGDLQVVSGRSDVPAPTGKGVLFTMQGADFFTQGFFVYAPAQQTVIEPYSEIANSEVGFQVVQDIVTVLDDEDLYDNQGARPNLSSPGADRFRIRLLLTPKEAVADPLDFLPFATVRETKIVQIKQGTDSFNQIEKRMAIRQEETTGKFVVNPFNLEIQERDSDGVVNKMRYRMPVGEFGVNPIAYLDGYRLEQQLEQNRDVLKPVSTTTDSDKLTVTTYKNYVGALSDGATRAVDQQATYLGKWGNTTSGIPNLNTQQRYALLNSSNAIIGYARIKSLRDTGILNTSDSVAASDTRYRIHLYDINMNSGQNFRDVAKMMVNGGSTSDVINLFREGSNPNNTYIEAPEENISLFEISDHRVKSVYGVQYTAQRHGSNIAASVSANEIDIPPLNPNESYIDEGQWTLINLTQNVVFEIAAGNVNSGTGKITGLSSFGGVIGDKYSLFYYVLKGTSANPLSEKTKTYREDWFTATKTTDSVGTRFLFTLKGGTALSNLYDGVELLEAYDSDSDGSNILRQLEFDGGQRDNYYGPASLIPQGQASSVDTIRAKVAYFEWSAGGDYFAPNSYNLTDSTWFDYGDIPTYQSRIDGQIYPLHNYFDFRQKLDPLANNASASDYFEYPRDGDQISHGVVYYNQRIDQIVLGYTKDTYKPLIIVNSGEEALQPTFPSQQENQMVLYNIMLGGNTKNIADVMIAAERYPRYTMSDIDDLRSRISNLEETVSLSFIENEAQNLIELGADGTVRSKTGFFVDDFTKGLALTASSVTPNFIDDPSWITQSLDVDNSLIYPKLDKRYNEFLYDSDNTVLTSFNSAYSRSVPAQSNVILKGDMLMLDYKEVLDDTLKQEMISWRTPYDYEERGWYNVNPFNVFQGEGYLRLNPMGDFWVDQTRLPDRFVSGGTVHIKINDLSNYIPKTLVSTVTYTRQIRGRLTGARTRFGFDHRGRRMRGREREREIIQQTIQQTTTTRERVKTRVISDDYRTTVRDQVVSVDTVPFIRQKRVLGKAEGLRPNTRFWLYFDNVRMDQWVLDIGSQGGYTDLINQRVHRKQYPSAQVKHRRHPNATGAANENVLISDEQGRIWFDMFIPNNAAIPVPRSPIFPFQQELRTWVSKVKEGVKRFGADSPRCFDYAGWKFRCGTKPVKLLDISANNNDDALSLAKTVYTASGRNITRRRDVITSRVIVSEDYIDRTSSTVTEVVDETVIGTTWEPYDPLAQTFTVSAQSSISGVFVTKVDVFLRDAPPTLAPQIPLQMQIRGVRNGVPMRDAISEQHRVYVSADSCRTVVNSISNKEDLDEVLSKPVTFKFPEPFYISAGEEYAIVLLAECDDYEVFVATTYDLILGRTDKRVSKQPATGSLFLSQNGSTWTPKQNQDLAYRIYTAKFKAEGAANFYSQPAVRMAHNYNTSLMTDSSCLSGAYSADSVRTAANPSTALSRFFVFHPAHGLGDGDRATITGLDSSGTYFGVSGAEIMNRDNLVDSANVQGYYVKLDNAPTSQFNELGLFGADSVMSNTAFNIDRAVFDVLDINLTGTSTKYKASFISGYSHADARFLATRDPRFSVDDNLTPGTDNTGLTAFTPMTPLYLSTPRYLANSDQQADEMSGTPSILINTALETTQKSNFGGDLASSFKASGYVSDVSPQIDVQQIGAELTNHIIDNQPIDSDNNASSVLRGYPIVEDFNAPSGYVSEIDPTLGTSPSKHITKPATLSQAANGLRIIVKAHKPPAASFDVYYRTTTGSDEDIYNSNWVFIAPQNNPPDDVYVADGEVEPGYHEYKYLAGGIDGDLPDFRQFQLKVVMRTTNTCEVPIIRDIKMIALI